MTAKMPPALGLISIFLGVAFPNPAIHIPDNPSYDEQIAKWHAERLKEINGEDGWTTLVGLFWLKEGKNTIGGSPSNDIVLPKDRAPKSAGVLWLDN